VNLLPGFDFIEQRHRLLEKSPAVFDGTLVHIDYFVKFRIDGVLQLGDDRAIVNSGSDFVNGDAVLAFIIFESPIDRRIATILGQRAIVKVQNPLALLDEPFLDDLVVEDGNGKINVPVGIRLVFNIFVMTGFDDRDIVILSPGL